MKKKKDNYIYENNIINNYTTNFIKQINFLIQNFINIFNFKQDIPSIYDVKKDKSIKY